MKLTCDHGGNGDRLLVLLHGLGATRHVWQAMLDGNGWDGSWIAPDLRGHGASPHAESYALGLHAADVAETVSGPWRETVVLGHSMGGAIALALASGWFGISPSRVHGLGIKCVWTEDELAGLERMAATPVRWFATKDEAAARYLKVAGLPASASTGTGVAWGDGGWRLASDPAASRIGPPPMRALMAAAGCSVHLARGETDRMVSTEQLHAFDSAALDIADAGHNAMVDAPGAVWDWLRHP